MVAFVTNNSFVDQIAFDGMRKHLAKDFDKIYILDLGRQCPEEPETLRDDSQRLRIKSVSASTFLSGTKVGQREVADSTMRRHQMSTGARNRNTTSWTKRRRIDGVRLDEAEARREAQLADGGLRAGFRCLVPLGQEKKGDQAHLDAVFDCVRNGMIRDASRQLRCLQLLRRRTVDDSGKSSTYNA